MTPQPDSAPQPLSALDELEAALNGFSNSTQPARSGPAQSAPGELAPETPQEPPVGPHSTKPVSRVRSLWRRLRGAENKPLPAEPNPDDETTHVSMAERSGFPEVDQLIEDFLKERVQEYGDDTTVEQLRHPENSHGMCQAVTEQFVEFAKAHGFKAYVTNTDLDEMGYKPSIEPFGEIGFDENDQMQYGFYPEHTVATIVLDDPNYPYGREVYIDFTASQYGYGDHPKVEGGKLGKTSTWTDVGGPNDPLGENRPAGEQVYDGDGCIYCGGWHKQEDCTKHESALSPGLFQHAYQALTAPDVETKQQAFERFMLNAPQGYGDDYEKTFDLALKAYQNAGYDEYPENMERAPSAWEQPTPPQFHRNTLLDTKNVTPAQQHDLWYDMDKRQGSYEDDEELKAIKQRLEYLRSQIRAERISMGEIAELQGLAPYIDPGDVELMEWAGLEEHPEMPDHIPEEHMPDPLESQFNLPSGLHWHDEHNSHLDNNEWAQMMSTGVPCDRCHSMDTVFDGPDHMRCNTCRHRSELPTFLKMVTPIDDPQSPHDSDWFFHATQQRYYRLLPSRMRDQVMQEGIVPNPDTGNPMHLWDNLANAQRYQQVANGLEPHDIWEISGDPGNLTPDPWFTQTKHDWGDNPGAWQTDATHFSPEVISLLGDNKTAAGPMRYRNSPVQPYPAVGMPPQDGWRPPAALQLRPGNYKDYLNWFRSWPAERLVQHQRGLPESGAGWPRSNYYRALQQAIGEANTPSPEIPDTSTSDTPDPSTDTPAPSLSPRPLSRTRTTVSNDWQATTTLWEPGEHGRGIIDSTGQLHTWPEDWGYTHQGYESAHGVHSVKDLLIRPDGVVRPRGQSPEDDRLTPEQLQAVQASDPRLRIAYSSGGPYLRNRPSLSLGDPPYNDCIGNFNSAQQISWEVLGGIAAGEVGTPSPELGVPIVAAAGVPSESDLMPYSLTEFCFDAADELEQAYPHLKATDGLYGDTGQHAWNVAPDGTIVDVTHGQFDPHTPVKIIRPGESGYDLYQPGRYSHTSALPPDRIWRGETRPIGDPSQAASIGMHWTQDPSAALVSYRDDEPDLQNVMWQARRNPEAEIPSHHPIWQGKGRPFSWEREVRMRPGQQAQVEGYYTWRGGGMPQPFTLREHGKNYDPNWAWTPMEQSLPVEHKGWIPYQERHPDLFKLASEDSPYVAQMWHGSTRKQLGPIRPGFFATSHLPEAEDYAGLNIGLDPEDEGVTHRVTVNFQNPKHYYGSWPGTDTYDEARAAGHDGVVIHFPEDNRDPSNPLPTRDWAYALDPSTVSFGHDNPPPPGAITPRSSRIASEDSPYLKLYHGTSNVALDLARQAGEFRPWHPRDTAQLVAGHYGLDPEEFYNHPYYQFSKDRERDPHLYLTTDRNIAQSYANIRSEQLDDALSTAHRMMNPELYNQPVDSAPISDERDKFKNDFYQHNNIKPAVVELNVPHEALPENAKQSIALGYPDLGTVMQPGPIPYAWVNEGEHTSKASNDSNDEWKNDKCPHCGEFMSDCRCGQDPEGGWETWGGEPDWTDNIGPCKACGSPETGSRIVDYGYGDQGIQGNCKNCMASWSLGTSHNMINSQPSDFNHPDPWMDNEPGSLTLPKHWGKVAADWPQPQVGDPVEIPTQEGGKVIVHGEVGERRSIDPRLEEFGLSFGPPSVGHMRVEQPGKLPRQFTFDYHGAHSHLIGDHDYYGNPATPHIPVGGIFPRDAEWIEHGDARWQAPQDPNLTHLMNPDGTTTLKFTRMPSIDPSGQAPYLANGEEHLATVPTEDYKKALEVMHYQTGRHDALGGFGYGPEGGKLSATEERWASLVVEAANFADEHGVEAAHGWLIKEGGSVEQADDWRDQYTALFSEPAEVIPSDWEDPEPKDETSEKLAKLTDLVATLVTQPAQKPGRRKLVVKRDGEGRIASIEEEPS